MVLDGFSRVRKARTQTNRRCRNNWH